MNRDRIGINVPVVAAAFLAIVTLSAVGLAVADDRAIVVALSTGLIGGLAGYCVGYTHVVIKLASLSQNQERGRRR